jgi:hypothetical protein
MWILSGRRIPKHKRVLNLLCLTSTPLREKAEGMSHDILLMVTKLSSESSLNYRKLRNKFQTRTLNAFVLLAC